VPHGPTSCKNLRISSSCLAPCGRRRFLLGRRQGRPGGAWHAGQVKSVGILVTPSIFPILRVIIPGGGGLFSIRKKTREKTRGLGKKPPLTWALVFFRPRGPYKWVPSPSTKNYLLTTSTAPCRPCKADRHLLGSPSMRTVHPPVRSGPTPLGQSCPRDSAPPGSASR